MTSSLDARNIAIFQKGGKDWVRFDMPSEDHEPVQVEFPVSHFVLIKRHGLESERRPVIELKARIGNLVVPTEFTLRDRSAYDFPVLIGVRFLKKSAIVDVSREYIGDRVKRDKKG